MKVRLILSFLLALFVTGNVFAFGNLNTQYDGLDVVLRGEVGRDTNRSVPTIPIEALIGDDGIVHILFTAPIGKVQIIADGQVQETCEVTTDEYETSFSVQGWAPGTYKLEFRTPDGGYVYGEFEITE